MRIVIYKTGEAIELNLVRYEGSERKGDELEYWLSFSHFHVSNPDANGFHAMLEAEFHEIENWCEEQLNLMRLKSLNCIFVRNLHSTAARRKWYESGVRYELERG